MDLTAHAVEHRAQRTDIKRVAATLRGLADGQHCGETQPRALKDYLVCIAHSLQVHQRVAERYLVPILIEMGVEPLGLEALDRSDDKLHVLLEQTDALIDQLTMEPTHRRLPPGMSRTLDSLVEFVEGTIDGEERSVYPLIRSHLTRESYRWIERQCHRSVKPQLLPFIVPWVCSHATDSEQLRIVDQAQFPMGAVLKIFGSCFLEKRKAAFG